jgi:hypothetical protein
MPVLSSRPRVLQSSQSSATASVAGQWNGQATPPMPPLATPAGIDSGTASSGGTDPWDAIDAGSAAASSSAPDLNYLECGNARC